MCSWSMDGVSGEKNNGEERDDIYIVGESMEQKVRQNERKVQKGKKTNVERDWNLSFSV